MEFAHQPMGVGDRFEIVKTLGEGGMAGRYREATEVYLEAADHVGPDASLEARRHAAECMLKAGRIEEGIELERRGASASSPRAAVVERFRERTRIVDLDRWLWMYLPLGAPPAR